MRIKHNPSIYTSKSIIMISYRRFVYVILPALALLFTGCAGLYFREAGKPPDRPPQFELVDWPYQEYWTGIVFNGAKIGFSNLVISPSPSNPDCFDIRSEAALRIRFLNFDKKINLHSFDQVAKDLSLKCFEYDYDLDGNRLKLKGCLENDHLEVDIVTQGGKRRQSLPVQGKLFTTGIINLYPLLHGLEIGRSYVYMVYDGETQTVSPVEQKVLSYEKSDLFAGQAFKIKTRLHGQEVNTWMDEKGRPLLEISMGGVIIAELESKSTAMKYLAQAALNKAEIMLDFSLIKSDIQIQNPSRIRHMEVALSGIDDNLNIPSDERQQCKRRKNQVICRIEPQTPLKSGSTGTAHPAALRPYLMSSYIIPSHDQKIRQTAAEIAGQADETDRKVLLLLEWIRKNIEQEPVDVFSALDVLNGKKAECQGHAFLYTAFARALKIPTRVANGIVYSPQYQGFLYHTWAESLVNGRWIAVDPTFQQVPADATHIKFIEGENISDLIPLVNLIGKIKLRIIDVD